MEFECQYILKDGRKQERRTHIVELKLVVAPSEVAELREKHQIKYNDA